MKTLESLVHPLVDSKRDAFLKQANLDKHAFVVLDIPLLFEKKYERTVDGVLVVSAGEEKQRERCLQREGMTETKLKNIVARQTPDAEKIAKADVVIDTACSKEETLKQVESVGDVDTRRPGGVPGENLRFERSGGVTRARP
jgi:dephospho-CoA kinase